MNNGKVEALLYEMRKTLIKLDLPVDIKVIQKLIEMASFKIKRNNSDSAYDSTILSY